MTSKQDYIHHKDDKLLERIKELEVVLTSTENSPIPLLQINLKSEVLYANSNGKQLLEGILSNNLFNSISQEAKDAFVSNCEVDKEYKINDDFFECKMTPLIEKGVINLYFFKITEHKISEMALRHSEYRYRKIIETASDIIYRSSPDGFFKYANPIALRKMKYSMRELSQKRFTDLILEEYVEKAQLFYFKQFSEKIPNTYFEFPVRAKDGNVYWLGQHVQAIIEDGKILEFLAVARDITEKRKAEEELIIARKKAEESARAKEQFLANMSHEIRTPLNVIMGMGSLLKEANLNSEEQEYLKAILNSSSNLLVIINDLLDLTKVEMGGVQLEEIEFDIRELALAVKASNTLKAQEKGLDLIVTVDEGIDKVLIGDPTRLNQVLLNLVNNAVKFTDKGSVELNCRLVSKTEDTNVIKFDVIDSGIGIAEEHQQKVFESFSQEDASVTRKYGGTGLGLAIAKSLVQQFGGVLKLSSKKNVGTTFSFQIEFPVAKFNIFSEQEEKDSENSISESYILIAEDNEFNQMLIEAIFKKNGIKYQVVGDGQKAIEAIKHTSFDLVLMDMQMPVMGGEEAISIIRKEIDKHIPIIALTANAFIGERERYLREGVDEYIAKPFTEADLLMTISKILKKEKP